MYLNNHTGFPPLKRRARLRFIIAYLTERRNLMPIENLALKTFSRGLLQRRLKLLYDMHVHVYVCVYIHIYIYICINIYINMWKNICIDIYKHNIHTYIYIHLFTYIHTHLYVYKNTCIRIYVYIFIDICIYVFMLVHLGIEHGILRFL